ESKAVDVEDHGLLLFCCHREAPGARDQWPSAAADQLDEVALGVCEVGEPPFRHPGVWDRGEAHGPTERNEPIESRFEIVHGQADVTQAQDVVLAIGVIRDRPWRGSVALEQLEVPASRADEHCRAEVVFGYIALKLDLEIERTAIEVDLSRKVVHVDTDVIQGEGEFSAIRRHS